MTLIRSQSEQQDADVLVIGSGLAGMAVAMALAPLHVILITPQQVGRGGSSEYAKGGIAATMTAHDTPHQHRDDTIFAGAGLTDATMAEAITAAGPDTIKWLEQNSVRFDRDVDDKYILGQEGAHSWPRIVHINGDQTGRYLTRTLAHRVMTSAHITVLSHAVAEHLVTCAHGWVRGALVRHKNTPRSLTASHVVLATGGIGGLFKLTTNPKSSTGRGLALAARAGACLTDLEFVQFHPTALNVNQDPQPLMTEALRGAGAKLVDCDGVGFMHTVSDLGDLAPRDIIARTLWQRQTQNKTSFLDGRHMSGTDWQHNFPAALEACTEAGLNPTTDLIPVSPAAHYHMGGIKTDINGQTSVPGLWALGEVACTGLHGANRLASNSLLEAVAVARQCAQAIQDVARVPHGPLEVTEPTPNSAATDTFWAWLRENMWQAMGVKRDGATMADWQQRLRHHRTDLRDQHATQAEQDALLVADMMVTAALARSESRGGHYRSDIPHTDPQQVGRLSVAIAPETQDITLDWQPLPPAHIPPRTAVA